MVDYSIFDYKNKKFIVSSTPIFEKIDEYINLLKLYNIKHVIRVCNEKTYPNNMFDKYGICLSTYKIKAGEILSNIQKEKWLNEYENLKEIGICNIAIHCVSGLGRAPLFLGLCLINEGMEDTYYVVEFIRTIRKNCLNLKQCKFLIGQKKTINCCYLQ